MGQEGLRLPVSIVTGIDSQVAGAMHQRGVIFLVIGPLLGLAAATLLFAAVAGVFGWYPQQMLVTATVAGAFLVATTAVLIRHELIVGRALRSAETRVRTILESAMDAVVVADASQKIILFNEAAEKVFQYPREKILGQALDMLLPERLRRVHHAHVAHFGATGATSRRMGEQSVLIGMRADGSEFPVEASISKSGQDGERIYTAILRDISQRVSNEQALRRSREELREMASISQTVREQEKSRVARELHDELGGALTALKMDVAWMRERLPGGADPLDEKLASMQKMLDQTVAATRRISADLRPMMLDDLGLVPAVEWLVQDFQRRSGIGCELAITSPERAVPGAQATAVFRILQESLTNVARHAGATQVEITLELDEQEIVLTVQDNGRGYSTEEPRESGSFGLIGMRERVYLLNGEVSVTSAPGEGALVEVHLPVGTGQAAA